MDFKLKWNGEEVESEMDNALMTRLEECASEIELKAQINCPVRTGNLQQSITHYTAISDVKEAHIGTTVQYGTYVEFGTVKSRPKPYLRPAAYDSDIFENYFKDLIKK